MASVVVTLDGKPVTGEVAPTAGTHRVTTVATDKAGNITESAASFEVVATFANTSALIDQYRKDGRLSLVRALLLKAELEAARAPDGGRAGGAGRGGARPVHRDRPWGGRRSGARPADRGRRLLASPPVRR